VTALPGLADINLPGPGQLTILDESDRSFIHRCLQAPN